jgi:hypothetical protein
MLKMATEDVRDHRRMLELLGAIKASSDQAPSRQRAVVDAGKRPSRENHNRHLNSSRPRVVETACSVLGGSGG